MAPSKQRKSPRKSNFSPVVSVTDVTSDPVGSPATEVADKLPPCEEAPVSPFKKPLPVDGLDSSNTDCSATPKSSLKPSSDGPAHSRSDKEKPVPSPESKLSRFVVQNFQNNLKI